MQYLKLKDIQKAPETFVGAITVCGWVRTVRESKTFGFIELNDGSRSVRCRSCTQTTSASSARV